MTVQTMTNRVQGLPKLSGNYRNPCPGFTETRVRELLKSVSGNLRNPHCIEKCDPYGLKRPLHFDASGILRARCLSA